uniref:RoaA n=1 Tax=Colacium vesiculosum TaxID=102910 RepID=I6NJH5_9EUGL|nr:RoaA [Colacium vesiculosum]
MLIFNNHFESRLNYLNYKLFLISEKNNLRLILILQKIAGNNLSSRLKSVQTIFCKNNNFLNSKDLFPISSKDKIFIALNLNLRFVFYNFDIFFFLKKNGLSFSFKLPFIYHKCFLMLCNFTVLPVIEAKLDRFSYGFRPFRNSKDCFLEIVNFISKKQSFSCILKANISFSNFNINWLTKYFPFNKNLLNFIFKDVNENFQINKNMIFFSTLFNFLLNELVRFKNYYLFLIRYKNNVLVFSNNYEYLNYLKFLFFKFLSSKDFNIKVSKQIYLNSSSFDPFYFLDWRFQKLKNLTISAEVSQNAFRYYKSNLKIFLKNSQNVEVSKFLTKLNHLILNWKINNNYSNSFFIQASKLDLYLSRLLWKWSKRRHPRRNNSWIYSKYWKSFGGVWKFFAIDFSNGNLVFLKSHNFKKTKRLYKLPRAFKVFNLENYQKLNLIWFKKSKFNFLNIYRSLWNKQKGICFNCQKPINYLSLDSVKIIRNSNSLNNALSELILIHTNCKL